MEDGPGKRGAKRFFSPVLADFGVMSPGGGPLPGLQGEFPEEFGTFGFAGIRTILPVGVFEGSQIHVIFHCGVDAGNPLR